MAIQFIDIVIAWLISVIGTLTFGVVGFRFGLFGWLLRQSWVQALALKLLVTLNPFVGLGVDFIRAASASQSDVSFKLCETRKAARITFLDDDRVKRTIWVPYNTRLVSKMLGQRALLDIGNNEFVDITQYAGVPYLVTPNQLGGGSVIIRSTDGDTKDRVIGGGELIMF